MANAFQAVPIRLGTLILFESFLIFSAVAAGAYARLGDGAWVMAQTEHGVAKALLITGVCQVCLYFSELYDLRVITDRRQLFVRILQAIGGASLVLGLVYYWFPGLIIGRGVFLIAATLVLVLIVGWRVAFEWAARGVGPRERLLLVGTNNAAVALARELHERRHELGVEIVGFIDADPNRIGKPVLNPGIVGTIEDIPSVARARSVDRVVVSLADARGKLPMDKLLEMKLDGVAFDHLASVYEEYTGKIALENLRPSWLIFSTGFRKTRVQRTVKRSIDLFVGSVALVAGLPLMLLIAAAVKATSLGPVFYRQQRVGQHGHVFTVHKFRSMQADAEALTGAVWARAEDPRITPLGGFLRRSRLDELPQLWNVLRGDMSLVGPRPERPEFVKDLTNQIAFYGQRHVVRPGITGWAQIRYTYGASVEDAMQKLQYDLYYIKNMSLALDIFILIATVKTVLLHRGA